jgi:hypothetical protein
MPCRAAREVHGPPSSRRGTDEYRATGAIGLPHAMGPRRSSTADESRGLLALVRRVFGAPRGRGATRGVAGRTARWVGYRGKHPFAWLHSEKPQCVSPDSLSPSLSRLRDRLTPVRVDSRLRRMPLARPWREGRAEPTAAGLRAGRSLDPMESPCPPPIRTTGRVSPNATSVHPSSAHDFGCWDSSARSASMLRTSACSRRPDRGCASPPPPGGPMLRRGFLRRRTRPPRGSRGGRTRAAPVAEQAAWAALSNADAPWRGRCPLNEAGPLGAGTRGLRGGV